MSVNIKLVYGFDFSKRSHPKIEHNLNESIVEILEEEELLSSVYSSYGISYIYLGKRIATLKKRDCFFSIHDKFMRKLNSNSKKYEDKVIKKIDKIINWLNTEGIDMANNGDLASNDVKSAICYFTELKLQKPDKLTIIDS